MKNTIFCFVIIAFATPAFAASIIKSAKVEGGKGTVRIFDDGMASSTYNNDHPEWPGQTITGQWKKVDGKYCVEWKWVTKCY
jgi:predicted lipoprotein with Yx(FWY)xxD motif